MIENTSQKGFTLIEMLAVVGIIIIVTATVLVNSARFGGVVQLENLAYDISLSTRESQIYGMSVVRYNNSYTSWFGVHFDVSSVTNMKMYSLFADSGASTHSNNYHMDADEIIRTTNITRGYYISKLCITPSTGTEVCSSDSGGPVQLDITYKHPDPDAYIRICTGSASNTCTATPYQYARIVVTSPRGDNMNICVAINGQISVHNDITQQCVY